MAIGAVYLSARVNQYIADQGASGAYLAASQATRINDAAAAGDYWLRALRSRPDTLPLLHSALQAQVLAGSLRQAIDTAERIIEVEEDNQSARVLLAVHALKQGQHETATAHLNKMRAGPFAEILTPNIRLWVALGSRDEAAVARVIEKLARGAVFASVPLSQAAQVLELNGDSKAAKSHYADAVRAGGARYLFFTLSYGAFLHRQGETAQARKLYQFFADRNLENAHIKAAQAQLLEDAPLPIERNAQAGLAGAFAAIAEIMQSEQRLDLALSSFRLAAYLAPQNDRVAFAIGGLLGEQKRHLEAAEQFASIAPDAISYHAAQIQRGQMLFLAGQSETAIAVLKAQHEAYPQDRDTLISLGDVYRSAHRYDEAEAAYHEAIEMSDEVVARDWYLYFARGMMRDQLDNWDMAEIDLQRARKLSGDEPNVLNYLGYSWIDRGIYLDEGLKIISQAVKKDPKNGAYIDSLGWGYYRLGKYDEALLYLERAAQIESADPVIADHLGDTLWRVGRKIEARYQWRKALAFDPSDEEIEKIERKLLTGLGAPEKKNPKAHVPRGGTAI